MQNIQELQSEMATTPLLQQYWQIKQEYPDALLFFQVGDFFELFYEDAKVAAACLSIALTKRGKQSDAVPLCGVPVASVQHYIAKLIRAGFKVALCQQTEPATPGKIVARTVTQVFTPGTLLDASLLDEKSASYLCSAVPVQDSCALLFAELLTCQLFATAIPAAVYKNIEAEMARFLPDEILVSQDQRGQKLAQACTKWGYYVTSCVLAEQTHATQSWAEQLAAQQNIPHTVQTTISQALLLLHQYLQKNQITAAQQFSTLQWYEPEDFLILDSATTRNLELVKNNHDGSRTHTLFALMDGAITAMGSRTIKKWILRPLADLHAISLRQEVVAYLMAHIVCCQQIAHCLAKIADAERIIGRMALGRAALHEYILLRRILLQSMAIKKILFQAHNVPVLLRMIVNSIQELPHVYQLLDVALTDDEQVPAIKEGFDERLDRARTLTDQASTLILQLERQEQERTGIGSLKIRYNSVFGYYIEVTKPNLHLVPADYIRSQTLVGKERFTTSALKQIETELLSAQTHIQELEKEIFQRIQREVMQHIHALRKTAQALAHLDALYGFSAVASLQGYCRPSLNTNRVYTIVAGKHPVVAAHLQQRFIPNDVVLNDAQSLWIITGPNMGGKSTYLRQVALITLMAHCGSFVPARQADIALCDRIFTRIGASDHVAQGKSTFLVEMEETATICAQATSKSLIIFDEVGRGTSTFDGLAIAQALVEYIHTAVRARTLFATHYHELTELQKQLPGVVCYHAASKQTAQGITLLYTIQPGAAAGSFGIEVAKLAQLPCIVIDRAQELLDTFEQAGHTSKEKEYIPAQACYHHINHNHQKLYERLQNIDLDTLSPKQAWDFLWAMKKDQ